MQRVAPIKAVNLPTLKTAAARAAHVEPFPADGSDASGDDTAENEPVTRTPLGELLIAAGLIGSPQLEDALREGRETGARIGEVVVSRGWATEDEVAKVLAEQWGLRYVDRASIWFDADALGRLSREDAQRLEALPTRVEDGRVMVAVAEPTDQRLAALREVIGEDTVVVVVPRSALQAGIHSQLLTSREPGPPTGGSVEPDREVEPSYRRREPEPEFELEPEPPPRLVKVSPPPLPAPLPAPLQSAIADTVASPDSGLDGVSALAAQARAVAESIEAQAAAMRREAAAAAGRQTMEHDLGRRVEELEEELAAQRLAMGELRRHLDAMLNLLSDR
jgi:type II secretion system (T2SS) protein E